MCFLKTRDNYYMYTTSIHTSGSLFFSYNVVKPGSKDRVIDIIIIIAVSIQMKSLSITQCISWCAISNLGESTPVLMLTERNSH